MNESTKQTSVVTVEIRQGGKLVQSIAVAQTSAIVGRGSDASIRLDNETISRHHAEIYSDTFGRWWVRDLGSRNGTQVNGAMVVGERHLGPEDRITVGPYELTVLTSRTPLVLDRTMLAGEAPVTDMAPGRISTLREMEAPRVSAEHLTALNELSRYLLDTPDPYERIEALAKLMASRQFQGLWAVVVRVSVENPAEPPQMLCQPQMPATVAAAPGHAAYISRGILRAVCSKHQAVLASNAYTAEVEMSLSPRVMQLAAIACPLYEDVHRIDLLYVTLPPKFGTGEWLALALLATKQYQQAESTWAARRQAEEHAALQRELEHARRIQMALLPRNVRFSGLDVAIGFVPCDRVGGDYVDAVGMADGRVLMAVADVCGKGLAAAMIAWGVHTAVHACVAAEMTLPRIMACLNHYLLETLPGDGFVTMVAVVIDPRTGAIEYVNAGHPPALLLGPGGEVRQLESGLDVPLGLQEDDPLHEHTGVIGIGQTLALYTDGLTEMEDESKQMLDVEGLSLCLREIVNDRPAAMRAGAMSLALSQRLDAIQGRRPPRDDRTFLLAMRPGGDDQPTR